MARRHTVLKRCMSWQGDIKFWRKVCQGKETYSFHTVLKKRMSWQGNIQSWRSVRHGEETYSPEEAYVMARKHSSLWISRLLGHWGVCYLHSSFFLQLFNDFINTWHASLYRGMLYRSTFCYRSLTHKMAADLRSWFLLLQFCISMYQ